MKFKSFIHFVDPSGVAAVACLVLLFSVSMFSRRRLTGGTKAVTGEGDGVCPFISAILLLTRVVVCSQGGDDSQDSMDQRREEPPKYWLPQVSCC